MVDGSLKNLGHTCYFNSVLQAMFGLDHLTALLTAVSDRDDILTRIQDCPNEQIINKSALLKDVLSHAVIQGRRGALRSVSAKLTKFITYLSSCSRHENGFSDKLLDSPANSVAELKIALVSCMSKQLSRLREELMSAESPESSDRGNQTGSGDISEFSDSSDSTDKSKRLRLRKQIPNVSPMSVYLSYLAVSPFPEPFEQADVAECFHTLVDNLHNEFVRAIDPKIDMGSVSFDPVYSSEVSDIFRGFIEVQSQCGQCGYLSEASTNPFIELQVDIPKTTINAEYFVNKYTLEGKWRVRPVSIADCVKYATRNVAGSSCLFCSSRDVVNMTRVTTFPSVLVLNVNRARFSAGKASKNTSHIEVSSDLIVGSSRYSLAAIIVHQGGGSQGGHYSCYSKRESGWKYFNDSSVRSIGSVEDVQASIAKQARYLQPCLVFYTKESDGAAEPRFDSLSPGSVS